MKCPRVIFERPDKTVEGLDLAEVLTPLSGLDLMIANGWGDTPQSQLPADWRTRQKTPRFHSVKGPNRRHIYGAPEPESLPLDR